MESSENTEQTEITEQTEKSQKTFPFVPLFPIVPYSQKLYLIESAIIFAFAGPLGSTCNRSLAGLNVTRRFCK